MGQSPHDHKRANKNDAIEPNCSPPDCVIAGGHRRCRLSGGLCAVGLDQLYRAVRSGRHYDLESQHRVEPYTGTALRPAYDPAAVCRTSTFRSHSQSIAGAMERRIIVCMRYRTRFFGWFVVFVAPQLAVRSGLIVYEGFDSINACCLAQYSVRGVKLRRSDDTRWIATTQ